MANLFQAWDEDIQALGAAKASDDQIEARRQQLAEHFKAKAKAAGLSSKEINETLDQFDTYSRQNSTNEDNRLSPEEEEMAQRVKDGTERTGAMLEVGKRFKDIGLGALSSLTRMGGDVAQTWADVGDNDKSELSSQIAQGLYNATDDIRSNYSEGTKRAKKDFWSPEGLTMGLAENVGQIAGTATVFGAAGKLAAARGLGKAATLATMGAVGAPLAYSQGYGQGKENSLDEINKTSNAQLWENVKAEAKAYDDAGGTGEVPYLVSMFKEAGGDINLMKDLMAENAGNRAGLMTVATEPLAMGVGSLMSRGAAAGGKGLRAGLVNIMNNQGMSNELARRVAAGGKLAIASQAGKIAATQMGREGVQETAQEGLEGYYAKGEGSRAAGRKGELTSEDWSSSDGNGIIQQGLQGGAIGLLMGGGGAMATLRHSSKLALEKKGLPEKHDAAIIAKKQADAALAKAANIADANPNNIDAQNAYAEAQDAALVATNNLEQLTGKFNALYTPEEQEVIKAKTMEGVAARAKVAEDAAKAQKELDDAQAKAAQEQQAQQAEILKAQRENTVNKLASMVGDEVALNEELARLNLGTEEKNALLVDAHKIAKKQKKAEKQAQSQAQAKTPLDSALDMLFDNKGNRNTKDAQDAADAHKVQLVDLVPAIAQRIESNKQQQTQAERQNKKAEYEKTKVREAEQAANKEKLTDKQQLENTLADFAANNDHDSMVNFLRDYDPKEADTLIANAYKTVANRTKAEQDAIAATKQAEAAKAKKAENDKQAEQKKIAFNKDMADLYAANPDATMADFNVIGKKHGVKSPIELAKAWVKAKNEAKATKEALPKLGLPSPETATKDTQDVTIPTGLNINRDNIENQDRRPIIVRNDGKPFPTQAQAEKALEVKSKKPRKKKEKPITPDTHEVIPVDGGFAIAPVVEIQQPKKPDDNEDGGVIADAPKPNAPVSPSGGTIPSQHLDRISRGLKDGKTVEEIATRIQKSLPHLTIEDVTQQVLVEQEKASKPATLDSIIGKYSDDEEVDAKIRQSGEVLKQFLPETIDDWKIDKSTFAVRGAWSVSYTKPYIVTDRKTGKEVVNSTTKSAPLDSEVLLSGDEQAIKDHINMRLAKNGITPRGVKDWQLDDAKQINTIGSKEDGLIASKFREDLKSFLTKIDEIDGYENEPSDIHKFSTILTNEILQKRAKNQDDLKGFISKSLDMALDESNYVGLEGAFNDRSRINAVEEFLYEKAKSTGSLSFENKEGDLVKKDEPIVTKVEQPIIDDPSGDYVHSQFHDATATVSKTEKGYDINWGDEVQSFTGKNAAEKTQAALKKEGFSKKNPDNDNGGVPVEPVAPKPVSPTGGNSTPQTTPKTDAEQIASAMDKTAQAITDAAHSKVVERIKNGEEIVYKQPAAVERVKQDDRYQVEINDKGHAVVKNVKDSSGEWVKQEEKTEENNSEVERIASLYAAELGHPVSKRSREFANDILNKNAYGLEFLANGMNDKGKKVFTEVTGISLPKQQGATWKVIRDWAGVSDEQENHRVAMRDVAYAVKAFMRDNNVSQDVADKNKELIASKIAEGFNSIEKIGNNYWFTDGKGQGINLSEKPKKGYLGLSKSRALIEAMIAEAKAAKAKEINTKDKAIFTEEAKQDVKEAVHIENGKAEEVTPEIIRESLAKVDDKPINGLTMSLKQGKQWLLDEANTALAAVKNEAKAAEAKRVIAVAKAKEELAAAEKALEDNKVNDDSAKLREAMQRKQVALIQARKMYDPERDYVTFNVPNDGSFKVLKTVSALESFIKKVNVNRGFDKQSPKKLFPAPSQNSVDTTIAEFLGDGEVENAYEFAKLQDKPIRFGAGQLNGKPIAFAYALAESVDLGSGFKGFVGLSLDKKTDKKEWMFIEENSRLSIGFGSLTKQGVIKEAKERLAQLSSEQKANLLKNSPKLEKTDAELEQQWLSQIGYNPNQNEDEVKTDVKAKVEDKQNKAIGDEILNQQPEKVNTKAVDEKPTDGIIKVEYPTAIVLNGWQNSVRNANEVVRSFKRAYEDYIQEAYNGALSQAETDAQRKVLERESLKLQQEYIKRTITLAKVRSGVTSSFIAGRANFNAKQSQSRGNAFDKAAQDFDNWLLGNKYTLSTAVQEARSPEQLAAIKAEKDAKAQKLQDKNDDFLRKVLSFKKGDDFTIGKNKVVRVNVNKYGMPISLTLEGIFITKGLDDKISLFGKDTSYETVDDLKQNIERIKEADSNAQAKEETQPITSEPVSSISKMQNAKTESYLNSKRASEYGEISIKELIDNRIRDGWTLTTGWREDKAAGKKLDDEFASLRRNAPWGNKNHPDTKRLNELEELTKGDTYRDGNFFIKEETYYLDSPSGKSMLLNKTTYEYAKTKAVPTPEHTETKTEQATEPTTQPVQYPVGSALGDLKKLSSNINFDSWVQKHGIDENMARSILDTNVNNRLLSGLITHDLPPSDELLKFQDKSILTYHRAKSEDVKSLSDEAFNLLLNQDDYGEKTNYLAYSILRNSNKKAELDYVSSLGAMNNRFRLDAQKYGGKLYKMAEPYLNKNPARKTTPVTQPESKSTPVASTSSSDLSDEEYIALKKAYNDFKAKTDKIGVADSRDEALKIATGLVAEMPDKEDKIRQALIDAIRENQWNRFEINFPKQSVKSETDVELNRALKRLQKALEGTDYTIGGTFNGKSAKLLFSYKSGANGSRESVIIDRINGKFTSYHVDFDNMSREVLKPLMDATVKWLNGEEIPKMKLGDDIKWDYTTLLSTPRHIDNAFNEAKANAPTVSKSDKLAQSYDEAKTKTMEQRQSESRAEKMAEHKKRIDALPIGVRRALSYDIYKEIAESKGDYVDGTYPVNLEPNDIGDMTAYYKEKANKEPRNKGVTVGYGDSKDYALDRKALRELADNGLYSDSYLGDNKAEPKEKQQQNPAKEEAQKQETNSKTPTLDKHNALMDSVRDGKATAEDFKQSFADVFANKDAILLELNSLTKDQLLKEGGYAVQYRHKNDKKSEVAEAVYYSMIAEYALGRGITSGMGKNSYENAVQKMVESTDQQRLDDFAQEYKQMIDGRISDLKAKAEALENPQTLNDFRMLMRSIMADGKTRQEAFLTLTPEQRIKYDELEAESTKEARETRKRAAQANINTASQTTDGKIIETKHTRDGYDLFVVQLSDRLSTDDYKKVLSEAKKLGGWYSSYKGGGAIVGFQFKDKEAAQAFLALAGGDTTAAKEQLSQKQDDYADNRSQSAAERLLDMAEKIEAKANEELDRDRKANTARRARFAMSAENEARAKIALAKTMRNIAEAIKNGKAKFLDNIRMKVDVEALRAYITTAKDNEIRSEYDSYAEQVKRKGQPPTAATADFATYPTYTLFRSDLAFLGRQLLEIDGLKKLGQQIMAVADDVSDAYLEFAKKNLFKVSRFSKSDSSLATFSSKEMAERSIRKSGLTGKAIVLQVKRGENIIILSPSEAINLKVWEGDADKRITLKREFGNDLVEAVGRRAGKNNRLLPYQFQYAYDKLKALSRIGIETPSEFRSALREFIALQEQVVNNKVREMEMAMVGRKKDGLDFFPTSPAVVAEMLDAAEIEPGMRVLEPSAGMGHIADQIREQAEIDPDVVEFSPERRELLKAKGHNVIGNDFLEVSRKDALPVSRSELVDIEQFRDAVRGDVLASVRSALYWFDRGDYEGAASLMDRATRQAEFNEPAKQKFGNIIERLQAAAEGQYDRIIMNPPFSNRQDAEHVRHAYELLRPNGRIVAIMGEGVFFGSDKKAVEFREWLESVGGTSEKLPDNSFMDSSLPVNTGVNARMVIIDKQDSDSQANEDKPKFSRKATESDSVPIYRIDNKNFDANNIKPHGLYVSIPSDVSTFDSPHKDVGDTSFAGNASPKNPLNVESFKIQHKRGNDYPMEVSAGVSALKQLVSVQLFERLIKVDKAELTATIKEQFPDIDTSQYYDAYELLEVLGAQLAIQEGYDAIIQKNGNDPFNEMVILDNSIIESMSPTDKPKNSKGTGTGLTTTQVRATLVNRFGEKLIKALEDKGLLKIVDSVKTIAEGALRSIKAYHGSPANFDRFMREFVNSGEGAQAFGWGHYLAGRKALAEWYRTVLSNDGARTQFTFRKDGERIKLSDLYKPTTFSEQVSEDTLIKLFRDYLLGEYDKRADTWEADVNPKYDPLAKVNKDILEYEEDTNGYVELNVVRQILEQYKAKKFSAQKTSTSYKGTGQLYEVDIAAKEESFLNWFTKFEDLSNEEQQALLNVFSEFNNFKGMEIEGKTIGEIYSKITRYSFAGTPMRLSQALQGLGYAGIKFLDQESRNRPYEKQYYNYVVFDENIISIKDRYYSQQDGTVEGYYHNGQATLIADNLTPETVVATFVHELGGHKGFQELMTPTAYDSLMRQFNRLVKQGNPIALAAKARAEAAESTDAAQQDEMLPYLLTQQATLNATRTQQSAVAKVIEQVYRAVKAWLYRTLSAHGFDGLASRLLQPKDITLLAERMIREMGNGTKPTSNKAKGLQFSQLNTPQTQINAVRKKYEGTSQWMKAPNGEPTKLNEVQWLQVRTPNFKAWFGDWENDPENASQVIDPETKEPLVVYHGSPSSNIHVFDRSKEGNNTGKADDAHGLGGFYFTDKPDYADIYTRSEEIQSTILEEKYFGNRLNDRTLPESTIYPVFLDIRKPAIAPEGKTTRAFMKNAELNHDGVFSFHDKRYWKEYVAFQATQIKSAIGNTGDFNPTNPDIRFSRKAKNPITEGIKSAANDAKNSLPTPIAKSIDNFMAGRRLPSSDMANITAKTELSLYHRTIGTQQNTALQNADFKKVYDMAQRYLQHVAVDAYAALKVAPNLLGKLESWDDFKKDIKKIWPATFIKQKADRAAVASIIFDETLNNELLSEDDVLKALTRDQRKIYKEARDAIEVSLKNTAKSEMVRKLLAAEAINWETVESLINQELPVEQFAQTIRDMVESRSVGLKNELDVILDSDPKIKEAFKTGNKNKLIPAQKKELKKALTLKAQIDTTEEALKSLNDVEKRLDTLIEQGYAPLMRFGEYTLTVKDLDGKVKSFFMFESKAEQARAANAIVARYGKTVNLETDMISKEEFKQFAGMTPETMALFAKETGMDKDEAYQHYLKLAIPARSAMTRMIKRKGTAGFSDDIQRVVASFVMSNARMSAKNIYAAQIEKSIQDIESGKSVKDQAIVMKENVFNPKENFAQLRNILFLWNLGGSIFFGLLNMTQPYMQTLPHLSQYVPIKDAFDAIIKGSGIAGSAMKNGHAPKGYEKEYNRAVREGVVDPQNVFMLSGVERGKTGASNSAWGVITHTMGLIAQVTESFNRKAVFIASLEVAKIKGDAWLKKKGFNSAYDFAKDSVDQTQGRYDKANRSNWANTSVGAPLMVFKQFSINYVEQMVRMWKKEAASGDEGKKAVFLMLAMLASLSGVMGLPFIKDILDVSETTAAFLGNPVNIEREARLALGKDLADPLFNGVLNHFVFNQLGIDTQSRTGMPDLVPWTNIANPTLKDKAFTRELMGLTGATGGLINKAFDSAQLAAEGNVGAAAKTLAPRFLTSWIDGGKMALTNEVMDSKGNKIFDTTWDEGLVKFIDANPKRMADLSRTKPLEWKDFAIQDYMTTSFKQKIINAMMDKDQAEVNKLMKEVEVWNNARSRYPVYIDLNTLAENANKKDQTFDAREKIRKGMTWVKNERPEM